MKYLLDTCVVSETISRNPNPVVNGWLGGIDEDDLFISSLTVGEIRKGIVKMPDCKRKTVLADWLDQLKANYAGRIVYVSTEVADEWGKRIALCETKGLRKPSVDSLIAVSAAFEGLTLVTLAAGLCASVGFAETESPYATGGEVTKVDLGNCLARYIHVFTNTDEAATFKSTGLKDLSLRYLAARGKTVYLTMVTSAGLLRNKHSGIVQSAVTLDDLFRA